MLKIVKYGLWLVVLVVLSIGFDQLMVRVQLETPGVKQAQRFYVDFRSRLIHAFSHSDKRENPVDAIEAVIEKKIKPAIKKTKKVAQRYLYVDRQGILQFADSLKQVPEEYRHAAQPLAE